ncbi:MAG: GNAT family N-acetyltransferase [Bryocella sp.]
MAVGNFIFGKRDEGVEILDLRHFGADRLAALLEEERGRWQQRLLWDYAASTRLLLEYIDSRVLPGYVAIEHDQLLGYTFGVLEGTKAVIGDAFAFGETVGVDNPICDRLLEHLIETLQATPGVDRIEAQLLLFPSGALHRPFFRAGFKPSPRLFMLGSVEGALASGPALPVPAGLHLESWRPEFYEPAAALIHRCYQGHMDAAINDQYRTVVGSLRFLHNIVRFPGCGIFDADNSWLLHDAAGHLAAMSLSSRVHDDAGHVTQLCVSPQWRGQNLGRLLLEQTARTLRQQGGKALSLTVTEANLPALRVYEGLGLRTTHRFDAMVWDR